jgi:SAM-dependent methyltransferase
MSASYPSYLHNIVGDNEMTHFWFAARRRLLEKVIRRIMPVQKNRKFLEVGCGNGNMIKFLEKMGFSVTGIDNNRQAIINSQNGTKADLIQSSFLTFKTTKQFDAIGIFDVLEHQLNDLAFLKKSTALLKSGGLLFITVPSGKMLWSEIDVISGHKKRYEIRELNELAAKAGLVTLWANYWQCFTFPLYYFWLTVWRTRHTGNVSLFFRTPPGIINLIMYKILMMEQTLIFRIGFPAGTSVVFVAQKQDGV